MDELPAENVYPEDGSAMLKVDRSLDFGAGGSWKLATDVTLLTYHGLVGDPNLPTRVTGHAEAEVEAVAVGTGQTGISHTETTMIPVEYQVEGKFYPAPRCEWELKVIETLFLSKVTSIQSTVLGTIPVPGLGPDMLTDFDVEFDQQSRVQVDIAGTYSVYWEIYDIALPAGTGCNFQ